MGFAIYYNGLCSHHHLRPEFQMVTTLASSECREPGALRRRALTKLDRELSKGHFKSALSLVKELQGKPDGLRGFGAARQIPRSIYKLDELQQNGIDMSFLVPLVVSVLDSVERSLQFAAVDSVSFNGRLENLMIDAISDSVYEENHITCMQHEAGHFLTAYLLGVLPRGYEVPSIEDFRKDNFLGGKVGFLGFEFLEDIHTGKLPKRKVNNGKVSARNLNRFSCIALAGLASECLVFGCSESSSSDVLKLDRVFKWLGFTESEVDAQVRWAVLNTLLILHRHNEARSRLAEAMALRRSVGFCIDTIENTLNLSDI
ncbi:uncharacterized protein LOC122657502 isoform X1 [Telopea speciosissima]|uniref:uncharacterized protein LOC122657502 isoform X1 n=1 Tax=Telopea speciosissima TaxID=54955 RepID=UPI001CC6EBEA|nr:uncharacterized protein LOC122657502 isoform X1 [Telopea speciosissima]